MPDLDDYERRFGRARAYTRAHPEPTLRMDVCGYEYAAFHPGMQYVCRGCGQDRVTEIGVDVNCQVAFTDMTQAMGRRQAQLGIACSPECADMLMLRWEADHRLEDMVQRNRGVLDRLADA